MRSDAGNTRASGEEAGCFPALLFALFLVAGGIVLWVFFAERLWLTARSLGWEKTACRIVVSRPERVGTNAYRPEIRYRYRVGNKDYASTRIWLVKTSAMPHVQARAMAEEYPEGLKTWCYVDREDPRAAVLERFHPQLLIALLPGAMALIGLGGLVARAVHALRPVPVEELPEGSTSGRPSAAAQSGPLRRRAPARVGPLLSAVLFSALWNGIAWFLVMEVIEEWSGGLPACHGWLLAAVAVPFVLVGVMGICVCIYLFMKLLNPRAKMKVSAAVVAAGEAIDVGWRFSRRIVRIRRLRIFVEGREEATYGRGEALTTAREVFTTIPLVDTAKAEEIRAGSVRFVAPADVMPSFESRHNRVAWAVCMRGEIRRWPDIDEEIEFVILPAASAAEAAAVATEKA